MHAPITIAVSQVNATVGAIDKNKRRIIDNIKQAMAMKADLIVFPELCLSGYPPEDLLFRPRFHQQITKALTEITTYSNDIDIIIGHPAYEAGDCYNAASWLHNGKISATYHKHCLPNYSVFDEKRYFSAGKEPGVIEINGTRIGLLICEDGWHAAPTQALKQKDVALILQISASPFYLGKYTERLAAAKARVTQINRPIICTQLIGAQDELIFDGGSFALNRQGILSHQLPLFRDALSCITYDPKTKDLVPASPKIKWPKTDVSLIYQALVLGVKDYVRKNNFNGVLLGLSGGIDSALTLAIAVDALGAEHVEAVLLPSRYTLPISIQGASEQATALGVATTEISIEPIFNAALSSLSSRFDQRKPDVTEENLQARARGMLLMALSNKLGKLVLTTGNKSELAVGYSTLYGDMAGGFDVLKDVYKTMVYKLAHHVNQKGTAVIPNMVIERPPSAELKENQADQDSLPDYALLDEIIRRHMEAHQDREQLVKQGFDEAIVNRILHLIRRNEYKRRQAPIGPKLTRSAFGKDWRYPITNGFDTHDVEH